MSNTPWRSNNRFFTCEPNCPKRKPGCQDHCERHARDKEKWDKIMAAKRKYNETRNYTADNVAKNKDISAKRKKEWRRYNRTNT